MDLLFLLVVDWMDGYALLVFGFVAVCSGAYVYAFLPETKGLSLSTVQVGWWGPGRPAACTSCQQLHQVMGQGCCSSFGRSGSVRARPPPFI